MKTVKLETCTLGDLIEFQRGYDLPKDKFIQGKYPVQSSNGILGYHNEYKVKALGITIGRSGTVGIPHLLTENFYPHNTTLFVKDFKGNDVLYIYYLLKYLRLNEFKTGSGVPTMNRNHLHPLKIQAYKDLKKQQSISKILSQLDQKIVLNNQINAQLEQMAKTLYDYWFVQFDFPNQDGKPYKSSGGEMVYNEQLKREIPKDWEVKKLADSINLYTGKEDANFATENGKYPFFTCGEATLNCDDYIFDMEAILLAGNGSFAIKRYSGKFNAYQRTYVLEVKNKIFYPIIYFCLSNNIEKFINGSRGSIIKFITKGDIENIYIALPNNERTFSFEIIRTFFEKQRNLEKQNQQLIQLRDFLLPMLMNGQVGVRDKCDD